MLDQFGEFHRHQNSNVVRATRKKYADSSLAGKQTFECSTDLACCCIGSVPLTTATTHIRIVSMTWYDIEQNVQAKQVLDVGAVMLFEFNKGVSLRC